MRSANMNAAGTVDSLYNAIHNNQNGGISVDIWRIMDYIFTVISVLSVVLIISSKFLSRKLRLIKNEAALLTDRIL